MTTSDEAGLIRDRIRARGLELGFSKVGFAPARLQQETPRLATWLGRGYEGQMGWMRRAPERRSDATQSLPGAETLICCAVNYYQGEPETPGALRGVISSYARGEDYHRVLEARLRSLAEFVEQGWAVASKLYVDTGPILEKSYAVAAGLGWQGKHTNIISQDSSSWFFLGEILVPMALPHDEEQSDRCGTCHRCIDACPTNAIVQPYVVDSRLCISYLTIELRGAIPRELRPGIGRRIYGCDDCQDVCPWNRFAKKSEEAAFFAREPLASMDLMDMLSMSRESFLEATRSSPIRRARYPGFLRNVAVALGNSRDPRAVSSLVRALSHEESLVRGHAAWALARIGDPRGRPALAKRLEEEPDAGVREELSWALAELDQTAD